MTSVPLDLPRSNDGHDVDEDLVDFLERHEDGPCPDCPAELHLAELLR